MPMPTRSVGLNAPLVNVPTCAPDAGSRTAYPARRTARSSHRNDTSRRTAAPSRRRANASRPVNARAIVKRDGPAQPRLIGVRRGRQFMAVQWQ